MRAASEVEAEAAEWLARQDAGDLDDAGKEAFRRWVTASTAHHIAYIRLQAAWLRADRLRVNGSGGVPAASLVDEENDLGLEDRVRVPGRKAWISGFVATLAAAAAAWAMVGSAEDYATPVGGFQRLPLADGSRVELNTNTEIEVAYNLRRRRIELERGEAFFQVAKDRDRPFIVEVGDYRVVAVGTAFSIRAVEDEIEVLVTEGTVRIVPPGELDSARPLLVPAGKRVAVQAEGPIVSPLSYSQIEKDLGWREGMLVFDDRPLREVAAEFNRYNHRQIVIIDPEVGDVAIGGRFRPTNLDGLVRLLEPGFGVEAVPQKDDRVLLRFAEK